MDGCIYVSYIRVNIKNDGRSHRTNNNQPTCFIHRELHHTITGGCFIEERKMLSTSTTSSPSSSSSFSPSLPTFQREKSKNSKPTLTYEQTQQGNKQKRTNRTATARTTNKSQLRRQSRHVSFFSRLRTTKPKASYTFHYSFFDWTGKFNSTTLRIFFTGL